jgi:hypothetical protein
MEGGNWSVSKLRRRGRIMMRHQEPSRNWSMRTTSNVVKLLGHVLNKEKIASLDFPSAITDKRRDLTDDIGSAEMA